MRPISLAVVSVVAAIAGLGLGAPAAATHPDRLVWHAETAEGRELATRGADLMVNPASVVKVGTTLWALDRLGASHRYATEIGYRGTWKAATGEIDGTLVVRGGGDPDFQPENGFMVALELNRLGIRSVTGGLVVTGTFWMGWEHGGGNGEGDQRAHSLEMGGRLARCLDPGKWDQSLRNTWPEFAERHGLTQDAPPAVRIAGGVAAADEVELTPLLRHISNPLPVILKRFNVFSNNDIERVADGLGGVGALQTFLQRELGEEGGRVSLETASGLGSNRMTARMVVRLLRILRSKARKLGLELGDLLPVPGCDPGPAPRMFPSLATGELTGCCPVKSGTLVSTDGGVAVLSGAFRSIEGEEILFCVAAPEAGSNLRRWRREEERWLLGLMESVGGAVGRSCGAPLVLSDDRAAVEVGEPGDDAGCPAGG